MSHFSYLAKLLIVVGLVIIGLGILLLLFEKIPYIGKLPGDILIKRKNFIFYFPLTTSIVLSLIVSLLLILIFRK